MTQDLKQLVDPFSSIDLEHFKVSPKKEKKRKADQIKLQIKEVATEQQFVSRQVRKKKPKMVTKSFSLSIDDCKIIHDCLAMEAGEGRFSVYSGSGSDVVRAALQLFSQQPRKKKIQLIHQCKGRNRN